MATENPNPTEGTESDATETAREDAADAEETGSRGQAGTPAEADLAAAELADTTISVAAHLESELEEALAEHRLTRPSYLVLDALERAEDNTMNQRDLVTRVRRTSGTMSVRLGRLERARMIEREPDPDNRRSVTVTLTDRGRRLVQAARPSYAERASRLVAGLPQASRERTAEQLGTWLAFFE